MDLPGEPAGAACAGPTVKALCELARRLLTAEDTHRREPTAEHMTRLTRARRALERAVLWAEGPRR